MARWTGNKAGHHSGCMRLDPFSNNKRVLLCGSGTRMAVPCIVRFFQNAWCMAPKKRVFGIPIILVVHQYWILAPCLFVAGRPSDKMRQR